MQNKKNTDSIIVITNMDFGKTQDEDLKNTQNQKDAVKVFDVGFTLLDIEDCILNRLA